VVVLSRGTHGVLTGYSAGVLTGCSRGTHGVLTGCSRGTHGVLGGYSRGTCTRLAGIRRALRPRRGVTDAQVQGELPLVRPAAAEPSPQVQVQGVLTGYSRGTHGVLTGYSRVTHRVLDWYSRVLTGYSRGTHGVLTGYSIGTHGYSRGTHGVLTGYSRGTPCACLRGPLSVRSSSNRRLRVLSACSLRRLRVLERAGTRCLTSAPGLCSPVAGSLVLTHLQLKHIDVLLLLPMTRS
jgi:hypothetical protein